MNMISLSPLTLPGPNFVRPRRLKPAPTELSLGYSLHNSVHGGVFMRSTIIAAVTGLGILVLTVAGQKPAPKIHRLEASPATVVYGYYWSEAKPALRIASGDIIDVDTLLTNSPMGLSRAGVLDNKIEESLKSIVNEVTGDRRGPGGHVLTGPVYVEGAEPGDTLEVKILSIDFALDYGYNGCS